MNIPISYRYQNYVQIPLYEQLRSLVSQLNSQTQFLKKTKIRNIEEDRSNHKSCTEINKNSIQFRKLFNNKTKQGQFFNSHPPQIPYLFVPKYKNETFIMPNRVFQKGQAGKRFHVKMIDTSVYSFQQSQAEKINKHLKRRQKNDVISGRKMQELNRILDENDGKVKAKVIDRHMKTRKIFNPTRTNSDIFSMADPMLQPKDDEVIQSRKTNLNKTFGPNNWRPSSRAQSYSRTGNQCFSHTTSVFSISSQR